MANYSRVLLSGSTSGRPIKVAATATPGTTLHTAVAGAASFDEVYLWVTNTDTSDRTLTVEFGGTTNPDDLIVKALTIPKSSPPIPVVTGQVLNGGLVCRAFASSANVLLISGYVNRIA
ncbi:MAG: hypothetical protein HYZ53_25030 [Planctomycetes bacterium]|nr:hypothetical protein [Planctomycetota bacterium]